jgi:hypothetical protein
MQTKRCSKCSRKQGRDVVRPVSDFHRSATNKDGYQSCCKACQVEQNRGVRAKYKAQNKPIRSEGSTHYVGDDCPGGHAPEELPEFEITVEDPAIEAAFAGVPSPTERAQAAAVVAELPPLDPIQSAYQAREEERGKRDLRREHRALLDENERLKRERDAYLRLGSPEILVYGQAKQDRSDSVACATLSDWHVDEPVEAGPVHGLNEFSPDIARERAEHCFRNLLALAHMLGRDTKIRTLHLSLLGDFISGWIHEELLANTAMAPGDAMAFVEGLLASGIEFLLRESDFQVEADCIPGNHGRMTKQVHLGDPTGTSLETYMYRALANRFHGNPRVTLRVSGQAMVYRHFYERFKMRLIHGYEVKYGGGVGGLTIPLRKALAQWNNPIRADLTVLGHFHQLFDGGDFIVNGSLIGYNTFAQAIKASAIEEPRQAFWLVHARKGGQKSVTAPIWLDQAHKEKPADLLADSVSETK